MLLQKSACLCYVEVPSSTAAITHYSLQVGQKHQLGKVFKMLAVIMLVIMLVTPLQVTRACIKLNITCSTAS